MEIHGLEERTSLVIRRAYTVAPQKLWRAWTEPQALSAWFAGGAGAVKEIEMDVRVGGRYHIDFVGGGEWNHVSGTYQEVEPHRRLVFSWAFRSTPDRISRVSLLIEATPTGCDLLLTHDRFFDETARNNHERGWTQFLPCLETFLERGA